MEMEKVCWVKRRKAAGRQRLNADFSEIFPFAFVARLEISFGKLNLNLRRPNLA